MFCRVFWIIPSFFCSGLSHGDVSHDDISRRRLRSLINFKKEGKEAVVALSRCYLRNILEGLRRNTRTFIEVLDDPAEIRTRPLANTSPELYLCSKPLRRAANVALRIGRYSLI
jgi:hypothetical protein